MSTINVNIKALRISPPRTFIRAHVTLTNLNSQQTTVAEISESGKVFEMESGGSYKIVTKPRVNNGQTVRRTVTINTATLVVRIPPMGEDCRLWLEEIKRMIANGEHQKAKEEILLAKDVYGSFEDPLPAEDAKVFEEILSLENTLPDTPARSSFIKKLLRFLGFR